MSAYLALAFSVGLLAILDTWLFVGPFDGTALGGLVWVSFIAWGCHFHSGGGMKGMMTAMIGMIFGGLVGVAAILGFQGPLAGMGGLGVSIAVGIGAFVICLASKIPALATIPASVYGFAALAGATFLKAASASAGAVEAAAPDPVNAMIGTAGAIIVGAIFGIVSEYLANAFTKKDAAMAAAEPAE